MDTSARTRDVVLLFFPPFSDVLPGEACVYPGVVVYFRDREVRRRERGMGARKKAGIVR